jgi:hypothetical protein
LVLTWASWSLIFGIQMPPQSGSLARSAQSLALGVKLGFLSLSAVCPESTGRTKLMSKAAAKREFIVFAPHCWMKN